MTKFLWVAIVVISLSSCTAGSTEGPGLKPVPGSITYNGQPRTKLTKAPVGSTLINSFYGDYGERVEETYVVMPDRSLKIVARHKRLDIFHRD